MTFIFCRFSMGDYMTIRRVVPRECSRGLYLHIYCRIRITMHNLPLFFLSTVKLERFTESDYHRLALQKLKEYPIAMESLGTPLKVHNIHLTDRNNHIDEHMAQVQVILLLTGALSNCFYRIIAAHKLETW